MKTTVFKLEFPKYSQPDRHFDVYDATYRVPSLPAYAVISHTLEYKSSMPMDIEQGIDHHLLEDTVQINGVRSLFRTEERKCILTLHYAGIRDYALLFPHVKDEKLRARLGQFARKQIMHFSWDHGCHLL